MTSYVEYNVALTPGQKDKLLKVYKKRSPTTIRLAMNSLKDHMIKFSLPKGK